MIKAIKEIITMLLVCLVTMLILAIALYQYIPSRKVVPEVIKYTASEDVKDLLEDNIDTKAKEEENKAVLTLTSSDLNNYRKSYDYVPGKSNPFALYTPTITGDPEDTSGGEDGTGESTANTTVTTNTTTETQNSEYYQNSTIK